jgi:hypothetical protein
MENTGENHKQVNKHMKNKCSLIMLLQKGMRQSSHYLIQETYCLRVVINTYSFL